MANILFPVYLIGLFYFAENLDFSSGAKSRVRDVSNLINYGPYYIISRSIDNCTLAGPKDPDNELKHSFKVSKVDRIKEVFRGNVIVPHDLANVSISISNEVWRDGGYMPFFYKMYQKPCKEKVVTDFLKNFFHGDKSCSVKKGNYTIGELSPTEIMKDILGTSFFYEKMSLTIAGHTRKGNIGCTRFLCESKPLPKNALRTRYNNKTSN